MQLTALHLLYFLGALSKQKRKEVYDNLWWAIWFKMNAAEVFEVDTDPLLVNSVHQEVDEHLKIYFLIQIWFHAGRDGNFFERIKTNTCVSSWPIWIVTGRAVLAPWRLSLVTLSCFPGLEPLLQYNYFSEK